MDTGTEPRERRISRRERAALLAGVPAFGLLPEDALIALADRPNEELHREGSAVVVQGEAGDRLFLIAEGRVEVSISGRTGAAPVATLGAGESFGEISLLEPGGGRTATVTALEPLLLLALSAEDFHGILAAFPQTRAVFSRAADDMLVANFLKQMTPFSTLDGERLRRLAARLERRFVSVGEDVVRQGEPAEECFLLRKGRVEVLSGDAGDRSLATLGPGGLFGEAALLTGESRNATVRAVEACELLVLSRGDLLEVIGEDPHAGDRMLELLRLRDRPRRVPGIQVHQRATATGETVTTLKDPDRSAYYRLSPGGWFVWQRLDGEHTLRDLTLEYLAERKAFAPQVISDVVAGLAEAGFVEGSTPTGAVLERVAGITGWERATTFARGILEWQGSVRGVDGPLTRLYSRGARLLYTTPGLISLAVVALVGLVAFVLGIGELGQTIRESGAGGWLLLFWIPATLVGIAIHEAGHAFTTKHFGREVPRVGVGWYWFGPIAFVDTSDMWLANRRERVIVSLAGPAADLVTGSLAAIVAWLVPNPILSAALWQFALVSYIGVIMNLNPLMEFDGYYVLMDLLEKPNLRPRALAWIGRELWPTLLRDPSELRKHRLELLYGLGSVLYIALEATLTVVLYRLILEGWLGGLITPTVAAAFAWVLAAAVVLLALLGVIGDLRSARRRPRPSR